MKKILTILIVLFAMFGCEGSDGGGGGGTAPFIDNAVLTDEYFNPKFLFNIGDFGNFLVYASDPDMDIETLFATEFYPATSTTPYIGPISIFLPSQSDVDMIYFLIEHITVSGPVGDYRMEFQIDDYAGHASNVFKVFYTIQ